MTSYEQFLREKISLARFSGFDVPQEEINPALKPHTRDIARWCVQGGNRAVFASFGLHKTATQLEIHRQIGRRYADAYRLQVMPLAFAAEGLSMVFVVKPGRNATRSSRRPAMVSTPTSRKPSPSWSTPTPTRT